MPARSSASKAVVSNAGPTSPGSLVSHFIDSDTVHVSGRIAVPAGAPRAVLVCVHGGGMTSGYFDSATHLELSVLHQFASAGFAAVAPDRPGYGSTPTLEADLEGQGTWLTEAVRAMGRPEWADVPHVLVGHSFGAMVCTAAAAALGPVHAAGLSLSGVGIRYSDLKGTNPGTDSGEKPLTGLGELMEMWWGSPELYPVGALTPSLLPTARIAAADRSAAAQWPQMSSELAARCVIPVHLLLGDRELWWTAGQAGLNETAGVFSSAPWVQLDEQRYSAHNTALGWTSRGYAHRVMAFVEDCLARLRIEQRP